MATVNDFIKTYMDVNQLLLQKQQLALAEENARIARLQAVQSVAQNLSDRRALDPLASLFGGSSGDAGEASAVIHGTAPGAGVTQRGLVSEGLGAASQDERARLADEALTRDATGVGSYQLGTEGFLSTLLNPDSLTDAMRTRLGEQLRARTATGMNTAQLMAAEAAAALPGGDQTEMARVAGGIAPSAGEVLGATTAAAQIRAQETGQGLSWDIANRNLQLDKERVASGIDSRPQEWRDPKFLTEQIAANAKLLTENPDLPAATKDLYQRNIFSAVMAMKGTVMDPYRDIPSPQNPGESDKDYAARAELELKNLMEHITNTQMNPRTFSGWVKSYLPGGGR